MIAAERQALLLGSHMTLLNAFVEGKKQELNKGMPYFDPLDAGDGARALLVLESPGPKAVCSNFVSRNNPDPTARNTFEALQTSGLPRSATALWNVVPWNVSTANKNGRPTKAEVLEGVVLLLQVIKLMPNLSCVVLCGRLAWFAEQSIRRTFSIPIIKTYHFASRSYSHTNLQKHIFDSLGDVLRILDGQRHDVHTQGRSLSASRRTRSSGRSIEHTVEEHRRRTDGRCQAIFDELRSRILAFDPGISEKAVKILVGYRFKLNFAEVHFLSDRLKIHLRPKDYLDPKGYVERLEEPGFTMDRRFYLSDESDLDYATDLIRQSYQDVADR